MLSHPVPIEALVGHYPTNKLIGRGLILGGITPLVRRRYPVLPAVSHSYPGSRGQIFHALLSLSPLVSALPEGAFRTTCMPNPRRQRSF